MTGGPDRRASRIPDREERPEGDVSANSVATLLAIFEQDYGILLARLSAQLRSPELAADALHDTYLKLRSLPSVADLRQPHAYLYRMALNLALNSMRKDARSVPAEEFGLEAVPDITPDPERSALAASEMEQAFAALHALPPKRREIFLARWRDEKTSEEIATAFGMHKRSVQKDLARAESYLRRMLGRLKKG
jgi:RNA polymerase sigma factor (sigma-70 family)